MRDIFAGVFALTIAFAATAGTLQQPTDADTIADGKAIYLGKAGALCATCHGRDAKGVPGLGPNLTDKAWLHGDGSVAFVEKVITEGIARPKQSAAGMPPMGGAKLSDAQVKAVAAYVLSLSK